MIDCVKKSDETAPYIKLFFAVTDKKKRALQEKRPDNVKMEGQFRSEARLERCLFDTFMERISYVCKLGI